MGWSSKYQHGLHLQPKNTPETKKKSGQADAPVRDQGVRWSLGRILGLVWVPLSILTPQGTSYFEAMERNRNCLFFDLYCLRMFAFYCFGSVEIYIRRMFPLNSRHLSVAKEEWESTGGKGPSAKLIENSVQTEFLNPYITTKNKIWGGGWNLTPKRKV